ncbi:MAG: hypothetical protein K9H61_12125 [Bacteroidia bacterium]|nr:hypothetical protein [Bacteroidia bacterium]MCF8427843.1 hypothetical protein [Bacteroidia bacterium]MCF8447734.1 hypothetical protein [Bacteroidia bacterium]
MPWYPPNGMGFLFLYTLLLVQPETYFGSITRTLTNHFLYQHACKKYTIILIRFEPKLILE